MTNSTATARTFNVYDHHDNFLGRAASQAEAEAKMPTGGHIRDAFSGYKVLTPAQRVELEETLIQDQAEEARWLTIRPAERGPIWKKEIRKVRARIASAKRDLGR